MTEFNGDLIKKHGYILINIGENTVTNQQSIGFSVKILRKLTCQLEKFEFCINILCHPVLWALQGPPSWGHFLLMMIHGSMLNWLVYNFTDTVEFKYPRARVHCVY